MADSHIAEDTPDLLRRAANLLAAGRPGAARPLLNAILRTAPASPEALDLEARLLDREGQPDAALAVLDRAVASFPQAVLPRLARAGARAKAGDANGALADAAEAVFLEPHLARAKALLGAALLELGQVHDARACLAEAVRAEPADADYRQALARAQEEAGDVPAAAQTLEDGIALRPEHLRLRTAAILLRIRHQQFSAAEELAEAARRVGVVDARVFGLLGHARSSLGRHAEAADAYEEARKLSAEDPYLRHLAVAGLAPDDRTAA